jgi:hypothetical protein
MQLLVGWPRASARRHDDQHDPAGHEQEARGEPSDADAPRTSRPCGHVGVEQHAPRAVGVHGHDPPLAGP